MDKKYLTKSPKETQKLGKDFARYLSFPRKRESRFWIPDQVGDDSRKGAVVLGLSGNLGGGKTTFLQGFAKGLGIKEKILSPTFVIQKRFAIKNKKFEIPKRHSYDNQRPSIFLRTDFYYFYHIDCYRLKNAKEFLALGFSAQGGPASGWKDIIKNPENIVAIEWAEKIKKALPQNTIFIDFEFVDENTREVKFGAG